MSTKNTVAPPPAYRVFISSTSEDLKEFRRAASDALTNIQAIPMGMERFTATSQTVIERCYEEIRQCQFCVCIIGFRYGSLYRESNYSYSELEFNEAERLGIPILVFVRHGAIEANKIDVDDFVRLDKYRKKLQNSASNRLTVSFTTPEDLRDKLTRALQDEFKRKAEKYDEKNSSKSTTKVPAEEEYLSGAKTYKNFVLMPGEFCDQVVRLRVRFDGNYGSWLLKEELFEAFSLPVGRALYLKDIFVLGADYSDIDDVSKHIDMFAVGGAAKWIRENNVTKGSVFEGNFSLEWKYVKNVVGKARIQFGASDAFIAKLILKSDDLKLITQNTNTATPKENFISSSSDCKKTTSSHDDMYEWLKQLIE